MNLGVLDVPPDFHKQSLNVIHRPAKPICIELQGPAFQTVQNVEHIPTSNLFLGGQNDQLKLAARLLKPEQSLTSFGSLGHCPSGIFSLTSWISVKPALRTRSRRPTAGETVRPSFSPASQAWLHHVQRLLPSADPSSE